MTAVRRYGSEWVAALLEGWLGPRSRAGYRVQDWPAGQLPAMCRALLADGSADGTREPPAGTGALIARALLDKSWRRLSKYTTIDGIQEGDLRRLGAAVARVLTAAEMTGAPDVRDAVLACIRKQRDQATMLELHAIRARSLLTDTPGETRTASAT